jgi:hypothetical protein
MIQLDFFQEDEVVLLQNEVRRLKESQDKVRKKLFAAHGELAKNYINLLSRLEIIEKGLCNGDVTEM